MLGAYRRWAQDFDQDAKRSTHVSSISCPWKWTWRVGSIGYLLAAQLASVCCNTIAAYLESGSSTTRVSPVQVLNIRMLVTIVICLMVQVVFSEKLPHQEHRPKLSARSRLLLSIRCIAGVVSAIAFYYSLLYLQLSLTITVYLMGPFGAFYILSFLNGTPVSWMDRLRAMVSMAGAALVVGYGFRTSSTEPISESATQLLPTTGLGIALLGALANSIVYVSQQTMDTQVGPVSRVKWFAIAVAATTAILPIALPGESFRFQASIGWRSWMLSIAVGVLGFLMEFWSAQGLSLSSRPDAAQTAYIQPLLAMLFEWVFDGVRPHALVIMGSLMVLISAMLILLPVVQNQDEFEEVYDAVENIGLLETAEASK